MSKSGNIVAGNAKSGNLPTQSAAVQPDHFTAENLGAAVKAEFGQVNLRGLRCIAACIVDLSWQVATQSVAIKDAHANLTRYVAGVASDTPLAKVNGTVREHTGLAVKVVKHLEAHSWAGFDVQTFSSIKAAIDHVQTGLVADHGTVEAMKAAFGKAPSKAKSKSVLEMFESLMLKAETSDIPVMLEALAGIAGIHKIDLAPAQSAYQTALDARTERDKSADQETKAQAAAPFKPIATTATTIDAMAAEAMAKLTAPVQAAKVA